MNDYHQPIEPTKPAYNNPYNYNPYESSPGANTYGLPNVGPPPPPKQRRTPKWTIIIAIILTVIGSSLYIGYAIGKGGNSRSTRNIALTKTSKDANPTISPTATATKRLTSSTSQTPPTIQAIPSSMLTADALYTDFANANLPVASPTEISNQWWASVGETYYPLKGGVQFTDTGTNTVLQVAVFNSAQGATTDVQDATSSPNGWATQTIQVNTCVLFSNEGPVDIQYYKPTMQTYCI
jgi:hypothetical protein